jgi:tRNA G18 (ribose-2'-O)-methylase SpoU
MLILPITRTSDVVSLPVSTVSSSSLYTVGVKSKTSTSLDGRSRRRIFTDEDISNGLEWEKFDFSDSPKWDNRFYQGASPSAKASKNTNNKRKKKQDGGIPDDLLHVASNGEEWESVHERETEEDTKLHEEFERRHSAWDHLDPTLIEQATNVLLPYVQPERVQRIREVLDQRTKHTRFLFENPANPSNVWACLRTLDSYGIQDVDVVIQSGKYKGKAALSQKRGMRTAMGSAKWLTLKNHLSTESALRTMKKEGYHILYTDVNPSSKDIRDVDWDKSGKPICIVMGNEADGVSQTVRDYADESFYLPMVGFAESFSLSVATASLCAFLLSASSSPSTSLSSSSTQDNDDDDNNNDGNSKDPMRQYVGPIRPGDLSEKEYNTLLLKGCLNSITGKTGRALFKRNGLTFPQELDLS